jgi:hypothetical protein
MIDVGVLSELMMVARCVDDQVLVKDRAEA